MMLMALALRGRVSGLGVSPTLHANQAATSRRRQGQSLRHMGFGQAPFPVHPRLARALADHAHLNGYDHVAGADALRQRALAYFCERFGLDPADYDLLVAPGSKMILYALQLALAGDLLLPVPSWVSYAPQATLLGDRVIPVPAELTDDGMRLSPDALAAAIDAARARGLRPGKLIVNTPNNPTGLCLPAADHAALAALCARERIALLSDEIYALTTFDGPHSSLARAAPEAIVTTGLSKHVSLGGWRVGFGLIPRAHEGLFAALTSIASETWSAVSAPVQAAAAIAVSGDDAIEAFIDACTRCHRQVARDAWGRLRAAGIDCPRPAGAFYLWPAFDRHAGALAAQHIGGAVALADTLLAEHGVLALPGSAFGAPPGSLTLRLSLCDYDGAHALAHAAAPVADFAPRVVAGCDAIARFAADLSMPGR